jgi:hypothetical protein
VNRGTIAERLARTHLRTPAEALREVVRLRERAAGRTKAEASETAWAEMWAAFEPSVNALESSDPDRRLPGIPENIHDALDPNYSEQNPGRQLRDGLLWAAMQFPLVVLDTADGPTVNLLQADVKPPNAFAVFVLVTYASAPSQQRRDLIARALAFAEKAHPDHHHQKHEDDDDDDPGFLNHVAD